MTKKILLKTQALTYRVDKKKIIDSISFEAKEGEFIIFLGQNGAGKSTLLRALAGMNKNLFPKINFNGKNLKETPQEARAKQIAWLPASSQLSFPYSVFDITLMGRYPWHKGSPEDNDYKKTKETLKNLGLENKSNRNFLSLSSGEQKLVELARTLAGDQKIILLDEPTAHLDLKNSAKIFSCLKQKAQEEQKTILLASHNLSLAKIYSDRLIFMKHGKILVETKDNRNFNKLVEQTYDTRHLVF